MSAFILSNRHINALLTAYRDSHKRVSEKYLIRIGKLLVKTNQRSINVRYNETDKPIEFVLEQGEEFSPEQIIQFCHCFEYQACEYKGWKTSRARLWILELIDEMASGWVARTKTDWVLEARK